MTWGAYYTDKGGPDRTGVVGDGSTATSEHDLEGGGLKEVVVAGRFVAVAHGRPAPSAPAGDQWRPAPAGWWVEEANARWCVSVSHKSKHKTLQVI